MNPPKPTSRQISEGDPAKRGVRKLREKLAAEPKATTGIPDCPKHLKGRARAAWEFWAPELRIMGIDQMPDAMTLEGACVAYDRAVAADMILEEDGLMTEDSKFDRRTGKKVVLKIRAHPAIAVSQAAWTQVRQFCCEFGFSPASRSRLAIEKKGDAEAELMAVLSQPRTPRDTQVQ